MLCLRKAIVFVGGYVVTATCSLLFSDCMLFMILNVCVLLKRAWRFTLCCIFVGGYVVIYFMFYFLGFFVCSLVGCLFVFPKGGWVFLVFFCCGWESALGLFVLPH